MIESNVVVRRLSNALRVAHEEGIGTVATIVRNKIDMHLRLLRYPNQDSVEFDGCTFHIKALPKTPMKLAMLEGEYEQFERRAVRRYVDPAKPVVELGACIGVVSCITNRLLQDPQLHFVVEANPVVLPLLQHSKEQNHCHFEIVHAAIAYDRPHVTFSPERDLWANRLTEKKGVQTVDVPAIRLRDLVDRKGLADYTLICDIEGHEYDLVMHDAAVLRRAATIILETHERLIGEQKASQILKQLDDCGFRTVERDSWVVVMQRQ